MIRRLLLIVAIVITLSACNKPEQVVVAPETEEDFAPDMAFEGITLEGDEISSDIFAEYELTMVNIWATWCGPCVKEMPELEELYDQLPEGVNLIGICTDAAGDDKNRPYAQEVAQQLGVTYLNVVPSKELLSGFLKDVEAIPTTVFFDKNGKQVGDWIVGAPRKVVETYLKSINDRLDTIGE